MDTDTDPNKMKQIKEAAQLAGENRIAFIVSCPCIELWFLLHFGYTSAYMDNNQVIAKLKEYYPEYEKNRDIYSKIFDKTMTAIKNAKKLEKYQIDKGNYIQTVEGNPHTEVYKVIEEIFK